MTDIVRHKLLVKPRITTLKETDDRHWSQFQQYVIKCECGAWIGRKRYDTVIEGKVDWLEHMAMEMQG